MARQRGFVHPCLRSFPPGSGLAAYASLPRKTSLTFAAGLGRPVPSPQKVLSMSASSALSVAETHFFVAGPPKGGTSWLMRLLDAHPEAACSGEGHYFDRFYPLLMKVFEDYQRVLQLDAKLVFSEKPVLAPVRKSHVTSMLRHFMLERFAEYDPDSRARAHGDKTPHNWKDMPTLFSTFPEAILIFINRDPRDAAVSLFGHAKRRQLYKMDPEGPIDRDKLIRAACGNWIGVNSSLATLQKERPERLVLVRYEDLLADTVTEYGRICAALGLSTDHDVLQAAVDACDFRKVSGRKPGERDLTSFFTSGTSGNWQTQLSPSEAGVVEDLCGHMIPAAGYEI